MKKIFSIILFITMAIFNTSCNKSKLEIDEKSNTPWIAANTKAVARTRSYFQSFMHSNATTETYWGTKNNKGKQAEVYVNKIVKYFKNKKMINQWPIVNSYVDGCQQRFAPYTFHLVSIEPSG